jgi:single-stranded-DNA-specific exonuclease
VRATTAACLVNRGIVDTEQAMRYMAPRLADLSLAANFLDMDRAAQRLADAVVAKERVGIFGDYDVDGITSAAVVTCFLKVLGIEVAPEIADRFSGYGMGTDAVERFKSKGCSLIVAVDLGTSDYAAAALAKKSGLDLIIIDHHAIDGSPPEAAAFVNPQREEASDADKRLAAVGLAFYFVAATRTALADRGYIQKEKLDLRPLLDLVALGTVADVMPLLGNNRILVFHGLRHLSQNARIGLRHLLRVSRIRTSRIRAEHIAFQIAPRLNAAGRLGRADEAFELLVTEDREEAERLAQRLDLCSQERRALEGKVIEAARKEIAEDHLLGDPIIFVAGDGWHRGVLGIVASRLVEEFGRPAFVVGLEGREGVGSVRGRGQLNVHEALQSAAHCLARFGGHTDAAGFTVNREQVAPLKEALIQFSDRNIVESRAPDLYCDAALQAADLDAELLEEINRLGPFGSGNPEPVFDIDGLYVLEQRVIGQDHLKVDLKTPSGRISAFGPRMGHLSGSLPPLIRTAASICPDEWRGDGFIELKLVAPPVPGS